MITRFLGLGVAAALPVLATDRRQAGLLSAGPNDWRAAPPEGVTPPTLWDIGLKATSRYAVNRRLLGSAVTSSGAYYPP